MTASPTTGPLHGVRVLELGSFIAGPFAGQLLGDYGADVIKVESPGDGDPMRHWGVTRDGDSLWWPAIGRNKRSVTLDLRHERARELVLGLAAECDVVLENFRPGVLERWGLDYPALSSVNPRIVVVHISGFGQTGPLAGQAGFGSVGEAMGGIRHTTGSPDRPPSRAGISLGDALASVFGVVGTLSALLAARERGTGQEVDVAIYEAVAALMESTMADYELGGVVRSRSGSVLPGVAPSNVYPTGDGAEVVVAANADGVFARLCKAMDRPDLAEDQKYARLADRAAHSDEINGIVAEWTSAHDAHELEAACVRHDVPVATAYTAADMFGDPHFTARADLVTVDDPVAGPVRQQAPYPRYVGEQVVAPSGAPRLGEHTDEVLGTLLGVEHTELEILRTQGIV